jgi:hypothetical protein
VTLKLVMEKISCCGLSWDDFSLSIWSFVGIDVGELVRQDKAPYPGPEYYDRGYRFAGAGRARGPVKVVARMLSMGWDGTFLQAEWSHGMMEESRAFSSRSHHRRG